MQTIRFLTTLLATTAAAAAVAVPAAHADSIAYVKDGNVWLTTTDGGRQFQVTSTGDATHVSQADDGTLLAVNTANHLVRLDRYGTVLSEISTPVSTSSTSLFTFFGPFDADISPDGRNAAYTWWSKGYYTSGSHVDYEEHNGTGFTHADALTGFTDDGYKYFKSWDAPEWVDNQTVLVGNGPGWPSDPIAVATLGTGDPKGWFSDPDNMHPMEPTISRNKRVLAAVVGPDAKGVTVYRDWTASLLGTVSACFTYSSDGHDGAPTMGSPTLNADGTLLAYSDGHDLMVAPLGDMTKDCPTGVAATDIVAGATSPDWGPADVPTSRPAATQPPGGGTNPGTGPAPIQGSKSGAVITKPGTNDAGLPNQGGAGGGSGTGAAGITFSVPSKFRSPATKGVPFTVRGAAGP
ncbi:MAG: hypothetical protein AAGC46_10660, partial [Solirubrobacteraceae bacterium]